MKKKNEKDKRNIRYYIRLNKEEHNIFNENADKFIVSSKAEYLRKLMLNEPMLLKSGYDNLRQFLKVAGEQGKYAGLLKIFIMEYDLDKETEKKILSLIDDIEQFRDKLKILSDKII